MERNYMKSLGLACCVYLLCLVHPVKSHWTEEESSVFVPMTLSHGVSLNVSFYQRHFDSLMTCMCDVMSSKCTVQLGYELAVKGVSADRGNLPDGELDLGSWCITIYYYPNKDIRQLIVNLLFGRYSKIEFNRCQASDQWSLKGEHCENISSSFDQCGRDIVWAALGGQRRLKVNEKAQICTTCLHNEDCQNSRSNDSMTTDSGGIILIEMNTTSTPFISTDVTKDNRTPNAEKSKSQDDDDDDADDTPLIAGIVIAVVLIIILIVVIAAIVCRRRRLKWTERRTETDSVFAFSNPDYDELGKVVDEAVKGGDAPYFSSVSATPIPNVKPGESLKYDMNYSMAGVDSN